MREDIKAVFVFWRNLYECEPPAIDCVMVVDDKVGLSVVALEEFTILSHENEYEIGTVLLCIPHPFDSLSLLTQKTWNEILKEAKSGVVLSLGEDYNKSLHPNINEYCPFSK